MKQEREARIAPDRAADEREEREGKNRSGNAAHLNCLPAAGILYIPALHDEKEECECV